MSVTIFAVYSYGCLYYWYCGSKCSSRKFSCNISVTVRSWSTTFAIGCYDALCKGPLFIREWNWHLFSRFLWLEVFSTIWLSPWIGGIVVAFIAMARYMFCCVFKNYAVFDFCRIAWVLKWSCRPRFAAFVANSLVTLNGRNIWQSTYQILVIESMRPQIVTFRFKYLTLQHMAAI